MPAIWNFLTSAEAELTQRATTELKHVNWASPLLRLLERQGGFKTENMPIMFEIRVGHVLHCRGYIADYEYSAGVGGSSVDFRISGTPEWLVEIVSLGESQAVKEATEKKGQAITLRLSTGRKDKRFSEEGEMVRASEKILDKAAPKNEPTKFSLPTFGSMHFVLADMRGFMTHGGDESDYRHLAFGASAVPEDAVRIWEGRPVKGLFEVDHPLKAARIFRERIHFIGFVAERKYCEGEILQRIHICANPNLLNASKAEEMYKACPLRRLDATGDGIS